MDEAPAATSAPAIEGTVTAHPPPGTGDREAPHFRPLQLPSAPFWVVVIGGFVGISLLLAASSALFVFAS